MQLLYYSLAFALPVLAASADDSKTPRLPCTIRSPTSGAFFDLNPIHLELPTKKTKDSRNESWTARGYDYGANFTLNFCGPVIEDLKDVVGVEEKRWQNVSAFYELGGKTYSIGQQNSEPVFRGRKLVLNYTDGSPCPEAPISAYSHGVEDPPIHTRAIIGDDDDDDEDDDDKHDDKKNKKKPESGSGSNIRKKNTIISLLCSSDPLAPPMTLSFVASPDSCTYIFEARTSAACGGVETAKQQLGPGGVFGVIVLIAVLVYLVGGCVYQRTVMHQRGWRQLPNYALWAGIAGFISDIFIISTSSCARFFPGRKGYSRVNAGMNGNGGRRGRNDSDDENRLIDQLDEEWDSN